MQFGCLTTNPDTVNWLYFVPLIRERCMCGKGETLFSKQIGKLAKKTLLIPSLAKSRNYMKKTKEMHPFRWWFQLVSVL